MFTAVASHSTERVISAHKGPFSSSCSPSLWQDHVAQTTSQLQLSLQILRIQELIILPLHTIPLAIHHPSCYMGQPESLWKLQGSQKSHSGHESCLSAVVVWSAANHCKSMAQLEQNTLSVSTGWLGTPFTFVFTVLHCFHLLINLPVCVCH